MIIDLECRLSAQSRKLVGLTDHSLPLSYGFVVQHVVPASIDPLRLHHFFPWHFDIC